MSAVEKPSLNPEASPATHVIVKGTAVYQMHDPDSIFTTRGPIYAKRVGPGNRRGWYWYRIAEDATLWRGGISEIKTGAQLLVGPKGAIRHEQK